MNRQIVPRAEADSRIAIINRDIRDLIEQSKTFASKAEIETSGRRRDNIQRLNEGRLDRLMAQLEVFRTGLVPRGEHSRWGASQETADTNLQRQIDELKKSFGDTFSLRDALIQMQRRIDALEGQRGQALRF